jgi:DNA-binding HxlR family transcriptional regulator
MSEQRDGGIGSGPDEFACWGVYSRDCATRRTLARIAVKWTILVVGRLTQRPCRFGELRRSIEGVSSKVSVSRTRPCGDAAVSPKWRA